MTLDKETFAKLKRAQELTGDAEFADVIARALTTLLDKKDPLRSKSARKGPPPRQQQAVSQKLRCRKALKKSVRVAVSQRDGGQCSYVGKKSGLHSAASSPF